MLQRGKSYWPDEPYIFKYNVQEKPFKMFHFIQYSASSVFILVKLTKQIDHPMLL